MIVSSISIICDLVVIALAITALVGVPRHTLNTTVTEVFFYDINILLILAVLRLVIFCPTSFSGVYSYSMYKWLRIFKSWVFFNTIVLIFGIIVLWIGFRVPYFYYQFTMLLISLISCVCQYAYQQHYRFRLIQRRIRLAEHWTKFTYLHSPEVVQPVESESKDDIDTPSTPIPKQPMPTITFPPSTNNQYSLERRVREAIYSLNTLGKTFTGSNRNQLLEMLIDIFENEGTKNQSYIQRMAFTINKNLSANAVEYVIMRLYVPQITTFLAMSKATPLVASMQASLSKLCVSFTSISHRMHWYLYSFFDLSEGSSSMESIQDLVRYIEENGEFSSLAVATGHADELLRVDPDTQKHIQQSAQSLSHSTAQAQAALGNSLLDRAIKYFPTISREEKESKAHHDFDHEQEILSPSSDFYHNQHQNEHLDDHRYTKYPLHRTVLPPGCTKTNPMYFQHSILFWNSLCEMSTNIFNNPQPRKLRTTLLQSMLHEFVPSYLPSSCIYAPIGHDQHRIYSIIIEECHAFSTVSRAPLLICLEVIDYAPKKRRGKSRLSWWKKSKKALRESMDVIVEKGSSIASEFGSASDRQYTSPPQSHQSSSHSIQYDPKSSYEDVTPSQHILSLSLLEAQYDDSSHESTAAAASSPFKYSYGSIDTQPRSQTYPYFSSSKPSSPTKRSPTNESNRVAILSPNDADRVSQWTSPSESFMLSNEADIESNIFTNKPSTTTNKSTKASYKSSTEGQSQDHDVNPTIPSHSPTISIKKSKSSSSSIDNVDKQQNIEDPTSSHPRRRLFNHSPSIKSSSHNLSSPSPSAPLSLDSDNIPSTIVFKENWYQKERRIRAMSVVGQCPGWRLLPVIVKSLDDLRQEQMISQLLFIMEEILDRRGVDCWLRPYDIISLSKSTGVLEAIPDTVSLDALKKTFEGYQSLDDFFTKFYQINRRRPLASHHSNISSDNGILPSDHITSSHHDEDEPAIPTLAEAKENFMRSLAGYSIACYLLQIKDRHNGNILIDIYGHIIHIDFGFVFGIGPGNITFEGAPFKLTSEMVEVMGGNQGPLFHRFRSLCVQAFIALRRDHRYLISALDMIAHVASDMPCFPNNDADHVIEEFRRRFMLDLNDQEAAIFIHELIDESIDSWTTTCFDRYERCWVGIF